jgi:gliding motility-associated-like protein
VRNDRHASKKYNLRITVLPPKNVAPVITGQSAVKTAENTPLRIQFSFLVVSDPDNNYPTGFSMKIYPGENYTISGSSIVPVSGFTGSLTVGVAVNDGTETSEPFAMKVSVTAANVAPTITGQVALSTQVNQPVTILLSHLSVSDPDSDYPSGFTLRIHPGEHYSVANAVITPAPEFSGTLTAGVTVHDGKNESALFDLKVQVTPAAVTNVAPSISGQIPLSISANQSLTLKLSHLLVTDPDNDFPSDFTLKVLPGENYSVNGAAITPMVDFTGELRVNVSVNDGKADSKVFKLNITIAENANIPPVITGQKGLKVIEGQKLEIKFGHLVVEDPDNRYPDDFTLEVSPGDNYSTDNTSITPGSGFVGVLHVPVKVNDGTASSELFNVKIEVVPQSRLEILGQKTLQMDEDSSLTMTLSDLMVNDPSDTYPSGFSLDVSAGDHYQVKNGVIRPEPDFFGNLTIPVTIRKGASASATFSLLVVVNPVNDAPVLLSLQADPLLAVGESPWAVAPNADVIDPDDEQLLYAEIGFNSPEYEPDNDEITFTNTENIHGVFDSSSGILFLIGNAALNEYQGAIRSVGYQMKNARDSVQFREKKMYLRLSDGKDISDVYQRTILLDRDITLDIPPAFTPNNDMANDTWKITTRKQVDGLKTFIRVYNQKGQLVFETSDLQHEWDGVFNGSPLPADVYFYTIEMDLSYTRLSYKGIVSILR